MSQQIPIYTIATIAEGETARIVFPLQELTAGVLSALDATNFVVSDVLLTASDGEPIDTVGDHGWVSAPAGTVYYDPDASDFQAAKSPYRVKIKVTDDAARIRLYPNHAIAQIVVVPIR